MLFTFCSIVATVWGGTVGKTLIKECLNEFAEVAQAGVQPKKDTEQEQNQAWKKKNYAGFPKPGMGQAC